MDVAVPGLSAALHHENANTDKTHTTLLLSIMSRHPSATPENRRGIMNYLALAP